MNKCKRILAFLLLAVMLLGLLPTIAFAADAEKDYANMSTDGLTNLVTGGDFENGLNISIGESSQAWNGANTKGEISVAAARGGKQSAVVGNIMNSTSTSTKWLSVTFTELTEGHTYRFVVYTKKGDDTSKPQLRLYDNINKSQIDLVEFKTDSADSTDWQMLYLDYKFQKGDKVVAYLRNASATAYSYCYFDDFAIYDLDEVVQTVTWKNCDGTVLSTAKDYAETPVWPYASGAYDFIFAEWDESVDANGNVTNTAQYTRRKNLATANGNFDDTVTSVNNWKTTIGTGDYSWGTSSTSYGQKGVITTDFARSGSQSVKVGQAAIPIEGGSKAAGGNNWVNLSVPVGETSGLVVGNTYRFVVYSLKDKNSDSTPRFGVRLYDADSKEVGAAQYDLRTDENTENWVKHQLDVKILDTTTKVNIYLYNYVTGPANYCYFDDFAIYDITDGATDVVNTEFYGANIDLNDSLAMNFYFAKANVSGENWYAMVNGEQVELVDNGDNYYAIPYTGISATNMNDTFTAHICDAEGNQVSVAKTESVRTYAEQLLAKADTLGYSEAKTNALKTAVVELLNYGAAAQTYFNVDTDTLANAGIDAYQSFAAEAPSYTAERTVDYEEGYNTGYYGTNIQLQNSLTMNLYALTSVIGNDGYAVTSFVDHAGNNVNQRVTGTENGSYLSFTVPQLAAADARQTVTVELYTAEGAKVVTVKESVESYIARLVASDDTGKYQTIGEAVLKYTDAAKAYFVAV